MTFELLAWTIQREARTGDGAGGKTISLVTVQTGALGTINYYARESVERLDAAAQNRPGPGVQTRTEQFVKFLAPFPPEIARDYLLVSSLGTFRVFTVRRYEETMQVDVVQIG